MWDAGPISAPAERIKKKAVEGAGGVLSIVTPADRSGAFGALLQGTLVPQLPAILVVPAGSEVRKIRPQDIVYRLQEGGAFTVTQVPLMQHHVGALLLDQLQNAAKIDPRAGVSDESHLKPAFGR